MELEDTPTQTAGQARIGTDLPSHTQTNEMTREQETEKTKRLYPNLGQTGITQPTAPPNIYQEPEEHIKRTPIAAWSGAATAGRSEHAKNFRLNKINEVQKILETERDKRANLAKKYQRGINVMSGFSYGFDIGAVGLGAAGIALLTTIVAAPIVMAMEGVALAAGGLSAASNLICDKVLANKTKKHIQIQMLAESKLNTVNDHISKALKDGFISDDEFTLILSELDKFYTMRDEIRNKITSKIDEETKESLIKQGKDIATEEYQNMLAAAINKQTGSTTRSAR